MLRVGLTGGIACGKSWVGRRLAERGLQVLDLDAVGREVTSPGSAALAEVASAFGPAVLTPEGALDRSRLAARVFGQPDELRRLNAIVHPRVRAAEARWVASRAGAANAVLVSEAALLVETGIHLRFDRLVVVHCAPEQQLARLRARDGLDEASARARIEAQMPVVEKRAFGHFSIDNSGTPDQLDAATDALFEELRGLRIPPRLVEPPLGRLLGGLAQSRAAGPRHLSPVRLLRALARHDGPDLEALVPALTPRSSGPWWTAARDAPPGGAPTALSSALVAWALLRRSPDPQILLPAAASLARLTHEQSRARADACVFGLLLEQVALLGSVPADLAAQARGHEQAARRWAGAAPSPGLAASWLAAAREPRDPGAAREAAEALGGDPALAGTLVGTAIGIRESDVDAGLVDALALLAAQSSD